MVPAVIHFVNLQLAFHHIFPMTLEFIGQNLLGTHLGPFFFNGYMAFSKV